MCLNVRNLVRHSTYQLPRQPQVHLNRLINPLHLHARQIAVGRIVAQNDRGAGLADFATDGRIELDPPGLTALPETLTCDEPVLFRFKP